VRSGSVTNPALTGVSGLFHLHRLRVAICRLALRLAYGPSMRARC